VEESNPSGKSKGKMTGTGCVLTLLSVAVIFGLAVPIVQWRDAESGQSLPTDAAIIAPLLIGATFHALGSGLLWLVGLPVWVKSEADNSPEVRDETPGPPQEQ
jgi:hypothetical protein